MRKPLIFLKNSNNIYTPNITLFILFISLLLVITGIGDMSSYSKNNREQDIPIYKDDLVLEKLDKYKGWKGTFPQTVSALAVSNWISKFPERLYTSTSLKSNKNKKIYYVGIGGYSYFRVYFGKEDSKDSLELIEQFNSPYPITALAFHPNGKYIASGDSEGNIILREIKGYKTTFKLGSHIQTKRTHKGSVTSLVFSLDGRFLISGGIDKKVNYWQINIYQTGTYYTHDNYVSKVIVSPDGKYLASSSFDERIILYDFITKKKTILQDNKHKNPFGHDHWISNIIFSKDGKGLLSTDYQRKVFWWDVSNIKSPTYKYLGKQRTEVLSISINPAGTIATSGTDGRIVLWKGLKKSSEFAYHNGAVKNIAFSPDGKILFSTSNRGDVILQMIQ